MAKTKKSHVCKYCGEIFLKYQSLGAHTISCKSNPNWLRNLEKREISRAKSFSEKNPLITYKLTCSTCYSVFERQLRKKEFEDRERHFCCRSCANKFSSNTNKANRISKIRAYAVKQGYKPGNQVKEYISRGPAKKNCLTCFKEFTSYSKFQRYCSIPCGHHGRTQERRKNMQMADVPYAGLILRGPYWHKRLGRRVVQLFEQGVRNPKLTLAYARYLMSVKEGRLLTADEEVDHKDGNRQNDDISNLQILTSAQHLAKTSMDKRKSREFVRMECPTCGKVFVKSKSTSFIARFRTEYNVCSRKCRRVFDKPPTTKILEIFKQVS